MYRNLLTWLSVALLALVPLLYWRRLSEVRHEAPRATPHEASRGQTAPIRGLHADGYYLEASIRELSIQSLANVRLRHRALISNHVAPLDCAGVYFPAIWLDSPTTLSVLYKFYDFSKSRSRVLVERFALVENAAGVLDLKPLADSARLLAVPTPYHNLTLMGPEDTRAHVLLDNSVLMTAYLFTPQKTERQLIWRLGETSRARELRIVGAPKLQTREKNWSPFHSSPEISVRGKSARVRYVYSVDPLVVLECHIDLGDCRVLSGKVESILNQRAGLLRGGTPLVRFADTSYYFAFGHSTYGGSPTTAVGRLLKGSLRNGVHRPFLYVLRTEPSYEVVYVGGPFQIDLWRSRQLCDCAEGSTCPSTAKDRSIAVHDERNALLRENLAQDPVGLVFLADDTALLSWSIQPRDRARSFGAVSRLAGLDLIVRESIDRDQARLRRAEALGLAAQRHPVDFQAFVARQLESLVNEFQ